MQGPGKRHWVTLPVAALEEGEDRLSLASFLQQVKQQWMQLGMCRRPLKDRELEGLARQAGFGSGLHPHQQPLPARLAAFNAWFSKHLEVIAAVGPAIFCHPTAQLVAGFDVSRAEAVQCLQLYGVGAFCLRLSSVAGHLVLSLVEDYSSTKSNRINHYLFTADRIRQAGLPRLLGGIPGCCQRLVDLSTGRLHRASLVHKAFTRADAALAPKC